MKKYRAQCEVRISGDEEHVEQMLRLLQTISMCAAGCTRRFEIYYDGDGKARLHIERIDGDKKMPNVDWKIMGKEPIKFDFV